MNVLEVTASAIIVLGGLIAWFSAKSVADRWVVALSVLALAALLGVTVNQRLAVERAVIRELIDGGQKVTLREFCSANPTENICR